MSKQTGDVPHLDPEAVERLRKVAGDQGRGFVAEMAQLFLDEATKSFSELRDGARNQDWKRVCRIAHSVKSSAATLGLMQLSEACTALEMDTKASQATEATAKLIERVLLEFDQAIPTLKTLS